jgi:hypothetical protein
MEKLHRTNFKAAQNLAHEERSIRPFSGSGVGEHKSTRFVRGGNAVEKAGAANLLYV